MVIVVFYSLGNSNNSLYFNSLYCYVRLFISGWLNISLHAFSNMGRPTKQVRIIET
nr:MAG TPA: hypothetical protein [Crassvirales sp.]